MLSRDDYLGWFACQALIAVVGCCSMQMYFYLDWRRSPTAGTLVSAPSLPYALNIPGGSSYGSDGGALRPGSPALRSESFARDRDTSPRDSPRGSPRGGSPRGSPRGSRPPGRAASPAPRAGSPRRSGSTSSLAAVVEAEGDAAWPSPRRPGGGGGGGGVTVVGAVCGAVGGALGGGAGGPTAVERAILEEAQAHAAEHSRRQQAGTFPPVTASSSSPHGYTPTSPSHRAFRLPDSDR